MTNRVAMLAVGALLLGVVVGAAMGEPQRRHFKRMDDAVRAPLPFSDGVLVGDTLYLAGKIGIDPKTGRAHENLDQEIRLALDAMKETLQEAGMSMDDLVYVQVFCSDLSLYDPFNRIYRTYFAEKFPARAFIGSGPLLRSGRFEIQGIAVKP
jgi:reactive intermediate/imine deaminase